MKHAKPILYSLLVLIGWTVSLGCGGTGQGFSTNVPHHFRGPTAMAVTPDPNDLRGVFLYVLNSQGDTLTVLDTKFRHIFKHHSDDEERMDIVRLGDAPYDIAITQDGNWLLITDAQDGLIRRVMAQPPYEVMETGIMVRAGKIVLPLGQPENREAVAYVTSPDTLELVQIAVGQTNQVETGRISLPDEPVAIAATLDQTLLAITSRAGFLYFVDTETFELLDEDTIFLGGLPGNMQFDTDGDFLFVVNNDPPQIQVVDANSRTLEETEVLFDEPLSDLGLTRDGEMAYITSQAGRVYVFSTRHHRACGASYGRIFFTDQWPQSNPELLDLEVFDCVTRDEQWYAEYQSKTDDWEVTGTRSGVQTARAKTNQYYISDRGLVGFRILPGTRFPSDKDTFYFETDAGVEPIRVGLVPNGVATAPYWKEPEYDLVFIANTGTHNVSIIYTEDQVNVGAVN